MFDYILFWYIFHNFQRFKFIKLRLIMIIISNITKYNMQVKFEY